MSKQVTRNSEAVPVPTFPPEPHISAFKDTESFKTAIREWSAQYEVAYALLYPARNATKTPPDPGPEIQMPPPPDEPKQLDWSKITWTCERVDDKKVEHVVVFRATGLLDKNVFSSTYTVDLRGEKEAETGTWGKDAVEIAYICSQTPDPVGERGRPLNPWSRILQARNDILFLAEEKAKAKAVYDEYHAQLGTWSKKMEVWYFNTYLPWEVQRAKWYVAFSTLRDWKALRQLEQRKRADFKYKLLRFALLVAGAGGLVVLGLRLWA